MNTVDLIAKLQAAQAIHGAEHEFVDETGHPVLPETNCALRYLGDVKAAVDHETLSLAAERGIVKGINGSALSLEAPDGLIVEVDKTALFAFIRALETLAP